MDVVTPHLADNKRCLIHHNVNRILCALCLDLMLRDVVLFAQDFYGVDHGVLLIGAEAPVGLLAGDLDAEDCSGFGVTSNLLGSGTQLCEQGLAVDCGAVGLHVSGLEEVALNYLVTAHAGGIFDAVLDGVGLFGQGCDLSEQLAEGVNVVGDGDVHVAGLSVLPDLRYCFVSDASVRPNYTICQLFQIIFIGTNPNRVRVSSSRSCSL